MARICELTGRKTRYGGNRKHRRGKSGAGGVWRFKATRTSRTWMANLRKVRVLIDGKPQTIQVSMKAYKKMRKEGELYGVQLVKHYKEQA